MIVASIRVRRRTHCRRSSWDGDVANAPMEGEAAPEEAPPPVRPVPSSGTTSASVEDESAARVRAEEMWRTRVAEARAEVDRARRAHETLSGMNLVPGYEYVDAKGRTVIGSVGELQQLTAAAKARRDAAEKALDDLLEQARRANVPPGWLR